MGRKRREKLAIPNLGNYTIALDSAVRSLGIEPWSSTSTPAAVLRLGIEAASESLCLPFKAHLGHFIEADNSGCGHALMVNSLGTCRLTYYRSLIETILRDMGRKIRIWGLGFDGVKPPVIRYFDPPLIPFIKSVFLALEKIKVIDAIEIAAWKTRPREAERGDTTVAARACFLELERAGTIREVRLLKEKVRERFARLRQKSTAGPLLRIGLIGEISLLRDRTLNQNIEIVLGELGAEVRNFFLLGAELENIFGFGAGEQKVFARRELMNIAEPYLANPVGGHALDSVAHTIRCAEEGFDGVVHVCPAGCMPEVSVRPILARISREKDLPVLELSFDEHTSAVGVETRLEAFADMLLARRERRTAGEP
jgi:predicted nucleotide-binding protein (sugar kinase/HSP70/actin superfamily)